MTKRIITMILAILMILPCIGSIGVAAEIGAADCVFYEDFENFDESKYTNASSSTCKIESGDSSYITVNTVADGSKSPTASVQMSGKMVMEFEIKNDGNESGRIYANYEGVGSRELFTMLGDGRGPMFRDAADIPMFFYNQSDTKPDAKKFNHIKLFFDFDAGLLTGAECNGEPVKFYNREYVEHETAKLPGKAITALTFASVSTSAGKGTSYDNIKVYREGTAGTGGSAQAGGPVEVTVTEDFDHNQNVAKLNHLAIIPAQVAAYKREDTLTRADFTMMAMKSIGAKIGYASENSFSDVTDPTVAAYVNMAVNMGAVSGTGNRTFEPDRKININEAVKIMSCLLGYSPRANEQGGYPAGYMIVANNYELLKGINLVSGNQLVTFKDAATLVANCMTAPMMVKTVYGDKEIYSSDDTSRTLLRTYHNLVEIDRVIDEVKPAKNKMIVSDPQGIYSPYTTDVDKNISMSNVEGARHYMWVDEDSTVVYMYPYEQYRIVYGYVSEYNDEEDTGTVCAAELDALAFSNFSGKIPTHSEFTLKLNGTTLAEDAQIKLVGTFGRAVIVDNQLKSFEIIAQYGDAYNRPKEGGLVKSASTDEIKFFKGTNSLASLENLDDYERIITIVDGIEVETSKLKANTVFDYAELDTNKEKLVLIVSTKNYSGEFEEYASDRMVVGGTILPTTAQTVYVSTDSGNDFDDTYDLYNSIGVEVKVFTDMSGAVRYMISNPSETEFYGVITGAKKEVIMDDSDAYLRVMNIGANFEEKEYLVDLPERTLYYPEIEYETAAANVKKVDGSGIYKFKVNGDKIVMITAIEWLKSGNDASYDNFLPLNSEEAFGSGVTWIRPRSNTPYPSKYGLGIVVDTSNIITLMNNDGEFEPKKIEWKDLRTNRFYSATECRFKLTIPDPVADLVLFLDTTGAKAEASAYGLVTGKTQIIKDGETYSKYTVLLNNSPKEYTQKDGTTGAFSDVAMYDYIYAYNKPYGNTDVPFSSGNKTRLGDASTWATAKGGTEAGSSAKLQYVGTFEGIKENHIKGNLNGETIYAVSTGSFGCYKVNSDYTKFKQGSIEEAVGKECYVIKISGLVRDVFYFE